MIGGHYVVNMDRHDGLQVRCKSIYSQFRHFVDYAN